MSANAAESTLTAAVDMVGIVNSRPELIDDNRFDVRGAEISLGGPIDSLFEGMLTFAGHTHDASFVWGIHEAYIQSVSLVPQTTVKAGQFLLGIGRLNQTHRHDWRFTEPPKIQREFFSEEAVSDTGVEVSHLIFGKDTFFEITGGVTNGYCYGHCDQQGRRPLTPLHYIRLAIGGQTAITGFNYWSLTDFTGERVWHTGVDWKFEMLESAGAKDLVQAEAYYRNKLPPGGVAKVDAGAYLFFQKGWSEKWSTGIRLDLFSELNRRWQLVDQKRENLDYGIHLSTNYQASENAFFRAGYTREVETEAGAEAEANDRLEFQIVYLFGGHEGHNH